MTRPRPITLTWTGPWSLTVRLEGLLVWHLEFGDTAATPLMAPPWPGSGRPCPR